MFNSTILDVLVGLIFTFLAVSLIASSVTEAVSSTLGWRANTLLSGIKNLVNDPNFSSVARDLYNHALVNPAAPGDATTQESLSAKPSYVDPQHFAGALIDVLQMAPNVAGQVQLDLTRVADPQLKQALQGLYDRSGRTIAGFQGAIAGWFNSSMDRVSGLYKRKTQIWSFAIGLVVAIALNVDAIHLAQALWLHPAIVEKMAPQASMDVKQAISAMNSLDLPIGWSADAISRFFTVTGGAWMVAGWVIIACATLFGAPFWFDALQGIANLRGTGPKPK